MKTTDQFLDQASRDANNAIEGTQRAAHNTLDGIGNALHDVRQRSEPLIDRLSSEAQSFAHRNIEGARQGSNRLRERALHAGDGTAAYIRDDPLRSMLYAAAAGAVLMALVGLIGRSRPRD
jgi:ElaB/YqjD/DUF883 family membrane-anchored ribosome-binding protein